MSAVSGSFSFACLGFCLLGVAYGIIYRVICAIFLLAVRITFGVASAYKRGKLLGLHDFYELNIKRWRVGMVGEELGNLVVGLVFGAGFIVAAYLLADAQVRLLFPLLCLCFFALSARMLRRISKHIGVFIAVFLSLLPECVAISIGKISAMRANRTKKNKKSNQN